MFKVRLTFDLGNCCSRISSTAFKKVQTSPQIGAIFRGSLQLIQIFCINYLELPMCSWILNSAHLFNERISNCKKKYIKDWKMKAVITLCWTLCFETQNWQQNWYICGNSILSWVWIFENNTLTIFLNEFRIVNYLYDFSWPLNETSPFHSVSLPRF